MSSVLLRLNIRSGNIVDIDFLILCKIISEIFSVF